MYEYKTGETNLVITSDRLKPSGVIDKAKKDGCPVVSVLWIHLSLHLNTLLPYNIFEPKEECNKSEEEKTEEIKNPELEKKKSKRAKRQQDYIELATKLVRLKLL